MDPTAKNEKISAKERCQRQAGGGGTRVIVDSAQQAVMYLKVAERSECVKVPLNEKCITTTHDVEAVVIGARAGGGRGGSL